MSAKIFASYMKAKDPTKAHAALSASGSERWQGCPGSVRLSKGIPSVDNPASLRGTNTHTLIQFILENRAHWRKLLLSREAKKFLNFIEFDDAMLDNALFAVSFVEAEKKRMFDLYGVWPQLHVEKKVELAGVGFGTADIILYHPFGLLHVMDYKNGKHPVEPEQNFQGLYYAHAAADEVGWDFSDLHITIIQPNSPNSRGLTRTWKTNHEALTRAGVKLRNGAIRTRKPNAPLVTNAKWCWFCPARPKCPAHMGIKEKKIMEKFQR